MTGAHRHRRGDQHAGPAQAVDGGGVGELSRQVRPHAVLALDGQRRDERPGEHGVVQGGADPQGGQRPRDQGVARTRDVEDGRRRGRHHPGAVVVRDDHAVRAAGEDDVPGALLVQQAREIEVAVGRHPGVVGGERAGLRRRCRTARSPRRGRAAAASPWAWTRRRRPAASPRPARVARRARGCRSAGCSRRTPRTPGPWPRASRRRGRTAPARRARPWRRHRRPAARSGSAWRRTAPSPPDQATLTPRTSTPRPPRWAVTARPASSSPTRETMVTAAPSRARFSATLRATPPNEVTLRAGFDVPGTGARYRRSLRSTTAPPAHTRRAAAPMSSPTARYRRPRDPRAPRSQEGIQLLRPVTS